MSYADHVCDRCGHVEPAWDKYHRNCPDCGERMVLEWDEWDDHHAKPEPKEDGE